MHNPGTLSKVHLRNGTQAIQPQALPLTPLEMVESTHNLHHQPSILDGPRKFYKDSVLFLHRCTKPDKKGIQKHTTIETPSTTLVL
jgi:hypothetical protein